MGIPVRHRQTLAILLELYPLAGNGSYVFRNLRGLTRPMSETNMNAALRRMGYAKDEMTGHGFRAIARRSSMKCSANGPTSSSTN